MKPVFAIVCGAVVLTIAACNKPSQSQLVIVVPAPKSQKVQAHTRPASLPSPWELSTSRNKVSGEVSITAVTGFGVRSIILRHHGKKVDCMVSTGEFLGTLENMRTRRSTVKYRFDNGRVVRQEWKLSEDNTGFFCPESKVFLKKMQTAKQFMIEFSPNGKPPQTESFDTSPMPDELVAIIDDHRTPPVLY